MIIQKFSLFASLCKNYPSVNLASFQFYVALENSESRSPQVYQVTLLG